MPSWCLVFRFPHTCVTRCVLQHRMRGVLERDMFHFGQNKCKGMKNVSVEKVKGYHPMTYFQLFFLEGRILKKITVDFYPDYFRDYFFGGP